MCVLFVEVRAHGVIAKTDVSIMIIGATSHIVQGLGFGFRYIMGFRVTLLQAL